MELSRRDALKIALMGSSAFLFPLGQTTSAEADPRCSGNLLCDEENSPSTNVPLTEPDLPFSPQIKRFQHELKIPTELMPSYTDETTDYYEITLKKNRVPILPGTTTEIWGYNGEFPGPTIRQSGGDPKKKGRQSVVRFINELTPDAQGCPTRSVTHLHGMLSLPQYDGFATDFICPQHFKDYIYPNDRAATLWYHDHAIDQTSRNVYMGLAGMYIVDDELERNLALPKGEYDVPLLIRDAFFSIDPEDPQDARLVFDDRRQMSTYGDVALVNGIPWPKMSVEPRKYRFRLLNISPSRGFQLALSRELKRLTIGETMTVIASDGGLLGKPVELTTPYDFLKLDMAERYEIIIDFSKYVGESVYLKNIGFSGSLDTDDRIHTLMRFDVSSETSGIKGDAPIPTELRPINRLEEEVEKLSLKPKVRTFRFTRSFNDWLINGKTWDEKRVDADPGVGDYEIWEFVNPGSGWFHPIHVHLIDMQILDRNGMPPRPYETGWKDVFHLGEFETLRVIGEFGPRNEDYVNRFIHGKFMMHCHNLVHEDHAMMTLFEVGKNGPEPTSEPSKPISQLQSFQKTYPKPPDPYDREAIEEYEREVYKEGR